MADVTTSTTTDAPPERQGPPKGVAPSPGKWVKDNLFSSPFNSVLTVLFGLLIYASWRGLLNFMFSHERSWDAVATNLRLLFTAAYPQAQYGRIWFCVGYLGVLIAMALAAYNVSGRIRVHTIAERGIMLGAVILISGLLAPFSTSATVTYVLIGGAIAAVAAGIRATASEDASVHALLVVAVGIGLPILSLWVIPYGHHALVTIDNQPTVIAESGTVARTTSGPWTVIFILTVAVLHVVNSLGMPVTA